VSNLALSDFQDRLQKGFGFMLAPSFLKRYFQILTREIMTQTEKYVRDLFKIFISSKERRRLL
jgi:hypothetical protein